MHHICPGARLAKVGALHTESMNTRRQNNHHDQDRLRPSTHLCCAYACTCPVLRICFSSPTRQDISSLLSLSSRSLSSCTCSTINTIVCCTLVGLCRSMARSWGIILIHPSLAVELPQRFLYCDIVDLELLDFFFDSGQTELWFLVLCASLIFAMSEMLYLFRAGLELVKSKCGGRSFEEMAERRECFEVFGFAVGSLAPRTELARLQFYCIHCCVHLLESALHLFEETIYDALAEFSFLLIIVHL